MSEQSSRQQGLPTDYYAPAFRVEVKGQNLDPTTKGDVLSVKVDMDLENADRFELTVNNWDDLKVRFKYSDSSTFDIGNSIVVKLGYANQLVTMISGEINSLAPRFPESGSPTMTVSGTSTLGKLKDTKPDEKAQRLFLKMKDYEIAQIIAGRNGLPAVVSTEGPQHETVWQRDLSEGAFLMERAKRIDFDFYVQVNPATKKESLYFVKPQDTRESSAVKVFVFEWGLSLINFTPKLSNSRQVANVTVKGWDPKAKKVISVTATADDLPRIGGQGRSGPESAGDRGDQVVDVPVRTQEEAKHLAVSLLREKAYEYLTGDGQVIGMPELRPGHNVELKGLGTRYSGTYYVRTVSHSFSSSGYTTSFGVRRIFDGGVTTT